jgi:hypothetical protein
MSKKWIIGLVLVIIVAFGIYKLTQSNLVSSPSQAGAVALAQTDPINITTICNYGSDPSVNHGNTNGGVIPSTAIKTTVAVAQNPNVNNWYTGTADLPTGASDVEPIVQISGTNATQLYSHYRRDISPHRMIMTYCGGTAPLTVNLGWTNSTPVAPPAPTGLKAVLSANGTQVDLTWDPSSSVGGAGYNLYRSSSGPNGAFFFLKTPGVITTYSDKGLSAGQNYCYKVSVITSDAVESPKSDPATCAAPAPIIIPATCPSGIRIGDINADGKIDAVDSALLGGYASDPAFIQKYPCADTNRDGQFNAVDVQTLSSCIINANCAYVVSSPTPTYFRAQLDSTSPADNSLVKTSRVNVTPNVILGIFDAKLSGNAGKLSEISFKLYNNASVGSDKLLQNVRLVSGTYVYGSTLFTGTKGGSIITFKNLNIPLSTSNWQSLILEVDVMATSTPVNLSSALMTSSVVGMDSNRNPFVLLWSTEYASNRIILNP